MYNRYVPGNDGIYRRQTVLPAEPVYEKKETLPECCKENPEIAQQQRRPGRNHAEGFDLGDLLLLCIIGLLLVDSEEEENLPLLLIAAAILFLQ